MGNYLIATPSNLSIFMIADIQGADTTAGGVLHAVTSYAQTLPDADDADKLEASAIKAMQLAAA